MAKKNLDLADDLIEETTGETTTTETPENKECDNTL